MTRGLGIVYDLDPARCRTDCLTGKCDTLAGSDIIPEVVLPGVFGTSCLDTRSKKR